MLFAVEIVTVKKEKPDVIDLVSKDVSTQKTGKLSYCIFQLSACFWYFMSCLRLLFVGCFAVMLKLS